MVLYILENQDWEYEGKHKFGVTDNLTNRLCSSHEQHSHLSYVIDAYDIRPTCEYDSYKQYDQFFSIVARDPCLLQQVEKQCGYDLHYLRQINNHLVNHDGSTEFIDSRGIPILQNVVEHEFQYLGLHVEKRFSQEELDEINENRKRQYEYERAKEREELSRRLHKRYFHRMVSPLLHQLDALEKAIKYFKTHDKGKLLWACGLGKTIFSLFLIKYLGCSNIMIGVPSVFLQNQFADEIKRVFPKLKHILCVGGDGPQSTTSDRKIRKFMLKEGLKFVVTTYKSCHLLQPYSFDFKVGDEAHHLATIHKDTSKYTIFHQIQSVKTLFMTATEKLVDMTNTENHILYSMDDMELFGECIDSKSVKWAIENKKICDYYVALLKESPTEFENRDELYRSAYATLIALETLPGLSHILAYTNSTLNADKFDSYVNEIINSYPERFPTVKLGLFHKSTHSKSQDKCDIDGFKKSLFGILSCVYMFGEGCDLPFLNGVVFAENMGSEIRIAQCALRPHRLDKNNSNKKAYVIIPYLESEKNKVQTIIAKLRCVDDNIEQRILLQHVYACGDGNNGQNDRNTTFNKEELAGLKLWLRYSKALVSGLSSLADEYMYVRNTNINMGLKTTMEYKYSIQQDKHEHPISNPENYFFEQWKGWYDYLGIDTSGFLPTKEEWKRFCGIHGIQERNYQEQCVLFQQLPKEPHFFYTNFSNISNELNETINTRRI